MTEPPRISEVSALLGEFQRAVLRWHDRVSDLIAPSGTEVVILETIRTPERQDWLFASGRTRPGPIVTGVRGNSPAANHVAKRGAGRAFDFAFRAPGLGLWDESHPWELAGVVGEYLGMRWGGRWKSRDLGHLEWPPAPLQQVIRRGARGAIVKRVQDALAMRGFDPGPADGIFGIRTEAALREFEERAGLLVDGELDAAVALQLGVAFVV